MMKKSQITTALLIALTILAAASQAQKDHSGKVVAGRDLDIY